MEQRICSQYLFKLFLVIHLGTYATSKSNLASTVKDHVVTGKKMKILLAQMLFYHYYPQKHKGFRNEREILEVHSWLQRWHLRMGFGFLDHGLKHESNSLLDKSGAQLTRTGKNTFAQRQNCLCISLKLVTMENSYNMELTAEMLTGDKILERSQDEGEFNIKLLASDDDA